MTVQPLDADSLGSQPLLADRDVEEREGEVAEPGGDHGVESVRGRGVDEPRVVEMYASGRDDVLAERSAHLPIVLDGDVVDQVGHCHSFNETLV